MQLIYEYMKAHIRINGVNPEGWKPRDIFSSFVLLPEPRHSFEEWKLLVHTEYAEDNIPEELTEQQKREINQRSYDKIKDMVNNG